MENNNLKYKFRETKLTLKTRLMESWNKYGHIILLTGYYMICAGITIGSVIAYRKIPWLNEFAKKQCMWLYGWKSIR